MKKKFAIIDIETTGGLVRRDKITEIAIVLHDGEKIVDQFDSLINPERSIPEYISNLTGITNEMVADAPKFYEVAKQVVQMTEGQIFVAHNARFDYGFIREEFSRLGYTYSRRQLCTVRLTKKIFPEIGKYSLDNLIRYFGIQVKNRHRALDDAVATTELLDIVLKKEQSITSVKDIVNLGVKESRLPDNVSLEDLHGLPEECGIYYFLNEHGQIIYVGKSINIKKRVMQHFAKISDKAAKLQRKVFEIQYTLTGSELIALLLENIEIKKHQPEINRALRKNSFPYVLHCFEEDDGYIHFEVNKKNKINRKNATVLQEFPAVANARSHLKRIIKSFELCLNKCDLQTGPGSCFQQKIGQCHGACIGEESPDLYNERAQLAIDFITTGLRDNMIILDQGRSSGEKSIVAIEEGHLAGWGYLEESEISVSDPSEFLDYVKCPAHTPEEIKLIHWYLNDNKKHEVIYY